MMLFPEFKTRFNSRSPQPRSNQEEVVHAPLFLTCRPVLFTELSYGRMDCLEGHSPRVQWGGTTWSIRWYPQNLQIVLVDQMEVLVVGRQGIHLLIALPASIF